MRTALLILAVAMLDVSRAIDDRDSDPKIASMLGVLIIIAAIMDVIEWIAVLI